MAKNNNVIGIKGVLLCLQNNGIINQIDDEFFSDVYDPNKAIVNQIQDFAQKYDITLPTGWKVELAKSVKVQLQKADIEKIPSGIVEHWTELFQKLCE